MSATVSPGPGVDPVRGGADSAHFEELILCAGLDGTCGSELSVPPGTSLEQAFDSAGWELVAGDPYCPACVRRALRCAAVARRVVDS